MSERDCVCLCDCVRKKEREREGECWVCVCVCVCVCERESVCVGGWVCSKFLLPVVKISDLAVMVETP